MNALQRWVRLWDRREPAYALALVRIAVGLVVSWDFATVARLRLVSALWAPGEHGGMGPSSAATPLSPLVGWLDASPMAAWILYLTASLSALCVCLGFFSRSGALLLVLSWAQLALLAPDADRGIDALLRNALLLLACSGAGATLSLDARLRHGRWLHEASVPAWPRYLLILQLSVLYAGAGWLKQMAPWTALGGYSALYITLSQPHYASLPLSPQLLGLLYPLLQLATFATVWFERLALLLPLVLWLRATAQRGGRLRTAINRARLLELWVSLGITFHLGLALVLDLGMFPWGCLALYPALAAPASVRAWLARAQRATGRRDEAVRATLVADRGPG